MASNQSDNSKKLERLHYILWVAVGILFLSVSVYYFYFSNLLYPITENRYAIWGTFGDFMGGTLNPLFALLSLYAIIFTIKIQTEELELTRIEMTKSSAAQEEQSKAFNIQNQSVERQTFENTFFKMIDLHNKIVDNFLLVQKFRIHKSTGMNFYPSTTLKMTPIEQNYHVLKIDIGIPDDRDYRGREVVYQLLKIFKACRIIQSKFRKVSYEAFHEEFQNVIGHYFGTIYQVLKFIDKSMIYDKERYSALYRSQFSAFELELLFYHGAGEIGKHKLMPLLIKYEFFEHLSSEDIDKKVVKQYIEKTKEINPEYSLNKVFGKNDKWKETVDEYEKKAILSTHQT